MGIGTYISIITLNEMDEMLPPKDIDWLNGYKKQDPYIYCPQEIQFRPRDTYRWKVGDGKRYSMQMEIKR